MDMMYNEVVKAISESTNRKQRENCKANALLMAQHGRYNGTIYATNG